MPDKFLIVGLGNPGRDYRNNRHNVGFMLLDRFVERHHLPLFTRTQGRALFTSGVIEGFSFVLAKPQTYVNLSGEAVGSLARFYDVTPDRLLICLDDIDLPLGAIRMRPRGTAGGHRGMNSIIEHLGTQHVPRLRIGVSRPEGQRTAAGHVLRDFTPEDSEIINMALDRAALAIVSFMRDGVGLTMSRYNGPHDRTD